MIPPGTTTGTLDFLTPPPSPPSPPPPSKPQSEAYKKAKLFTPQLRVIGLPTYGHVWMAFFVIHAQSILSKITNYWLYIYSEMAHFSPWELVLRFLLRQILRHIV